MAHRRQPGLPPIRGRDAIDLDAIRVHGHSQHGHVVLPANDRPQASKWRVEDGERGRVAETPYKTLGRGRHDLAVFAQIAVWRDEYGCAVESASLPLDDANHHVNPKLGSEDDKLVQSWSRNVNGALPVPAEVIAAFRSTVADHGAEGDASGIAGDESLGKQHQARSPSGCVGGQFLNLGKRGGAIEDDRCSLDHRDSLALDGAHYYLTSPGGRVSLHLPPAGGHRPLDARTQSRPLVPLPGGGWLPHCSGQRLMVRSRGIQAWCRALTTLGLDGADRPETPKTALVDPVAARLPGRHDLWPRPRMHGVLSASVRIDHEDGSSAQVAERE